MKAISAGVARKSTSAMSRRPLITQSSDKHAGGKTLHSPTGAPLTKSYSDLKQDSAGLINWHTVTMCPM